MISGRNVSWFVVKRQENSRAGVSARGVGLRGIGISRNQTSSYQSAIIPLELPTIMSISVQPVVELEFISPEPAALTKYFTDAFHSEASSWEDGAMLKFKSKISAMVRPPRPTDTKQRTIPWISVPDLATEVPRLEALGATVHTNKTEVDGMGSWVYIQVLPLSPSASLPHILIF